MGAEGTEVQKTLIAAIEPGFPDIVRAWALWNLSRIGLQDEKTDKALARAISDEDFDYGNSYYEFKFKSEALKSMARVKTQSPEAQNAIIRVLVHRNGIDNNTTKLKITDSHTLRGMAAATLGAIGYVNEPTQVALAQVLPDSTWYGNKNYVAHALCKIGLIVPVGEKTKAIIKQNKQYNDIFTKVFNWKL